ncbi:hypothetical protein [Natribacillus halophilus]|uniref:Uncharacterized protein n=1 Tax=Natribacillus halophilus TaxID=549003 RepID=A0A1G8KC18_9BACI|nr:hypothetical protein [Natribacillus halophilus]SDI40889.1 hypothetical protein SAMN04488123_1029 [Natribacillus halophilus]
MANKENKAVSWVDIAVFVLFVFLLITMDFNNMTAMNWFSIVLFGAYVLLFFIKFFMDRSSEK